MKEGQNLKKIIAFIKKEIVLSAAWLLAVISAFFVHPDAEYLDYIDWRTLGILWGLMVIMKGLSKNHVFDMAGNALLKKTGKSRQLCTILIMLCFFCSMFITNDVSLITFVPFAMMVLKSINKENLIIPVLVLQTIAANLGSMLTPIGNPQNLFLYGLSGAGIGEFVLIMLPYTVISLLMILVGIMLLPGNKEKISIAGSSVKHEFSKTDIAFYFVLFVLALAVVTRFVHYLVLVGAVLIYVLVSDRKLILKADYILLLTFVGFFIFTGNMARIDAVSEVLSKLISGKEILVGAAVSQVISNVPAALLLSGFTENLRGLLIGVNIGGLGTLIASMASLITYKAYCNEYPEGKGKFFRLFTAENIIGLVVLGIAAIFVN
ncbi:MAG: SLC13 family permease [Clostridia bacterium]|nr:SLC13 family permease [Clostridia bacterium]